MTRLFGNVLMLLGGAILTQTLLFFALMRDYDFYLWIINRLETSDFGGANMQIIIYGLGILSGLLLLGIGYVTRHFKITT